MLKETTIKKLRDQLNIILSNHARNDFLTTNLNKQGKLYKKRRPYCIGSEGVYITELLKELSKSEVDRDAEEVIKAFIWNYRRTRPEFLEYDINRMTLL